MDLTKVNTVVLQIAVIDSVVQVLDVVFLKDGNVTVVCLENMLKRCNFLQNIISFRQRLY